MEHLSADEWALRHDQVVIAGYFVTALGHVSMALGGEVLVAEVAGLPTDAASMWPANALRFLDDRYPGAAEQVFSHVEAAQAEAHAAF